MNPTFLKIHGGVWINASDIIYVRPAEGGGCYIELRNGSGFGDPRTPDDVLHHHEAQTEIEWRETR